jgi:lysophospholipase L1-like esterase
MNWIKKDYFIMVVVIIMLLALVDFLLKTFVPLPKATEYAVKTKIHGSSAYDYLPNDKRPKNIAKPYLLYANTPGYENKYGVQHDSKGYRESNTVVINAEKKFLAIGGSTTYGYGVNNPKDAWPNKLQEYFNYSGKKIDVINGGLNYATTAELLIKYILKDQWIEHDLLILHTGGNEMLPIFFPGFKDDYSHVRMQTGQTSGVLERFFLKNSGIFRHLWGAWSSGSGFGLTKGQPYSFSLLNPKSVSERIKDNDRYQMFSRNINTIIKIAKMHNRKVLIVPYLNNQKEPSLNRPDVSFLDSQVLLYQKKMEGILHDIAKFNAVDFLNISSGVVSDENFIDNCHLNKIGHEEKAKAIFNYYLNNEY